MKAHRVTNGFRGIIPDIETYEKLKRDEVGWDPHVEAQMAEIILPYELFVRLMELDKEKSDVHE